LLLLLLPVACWPWQVFRNECRPGQNQSRNEIIAVPCSLALIEGGNSCSTFYYGSRVVVVVVIVVVGGVGVVAAAEAAAAKAAAKVAKQHVA